MFWYWNVRIYDKADHYWHGQVMTGRDLKEIGDMQEFYHTLTGCKMVIEGMCEQEYRSIAPIREAFEGLWLSKTALTS